MFFERFCTVVYDGYAGNGLRAEGAQERYSTGADCHQAHAERCRHLADTPREKHIREDAEGKCCFWSRKEGTTTDRSRTNNGQTSPTSASGKSKRQIADATLDDYNNNEQEINRYSEGRISANRSWTNTYDENDGEYLKMQAEMNEWMPQDTVILYENLLKQLSRNRKKVWGRDIFNNKSLSFEPNMNMALPRNYRIGPGDAVFIDVYGASQKSYQTTVAPDGYVTLEGFGPVQVSGLTVDQANNRIREKIGKRFSSSNIRLSVGQTHTIMVNVVGEVKTPGTYTLSALPLFSTHFTWLAVLVT